MVRRLDAPSRRTVLTRVSAAGTSTRRVAWSSTPGFSDTIELLHSASPWLAPLVRGLP
jgi:hypothetical protein